MSGDKQAKILHACGTTLLLVILVTAQAPVIIPLFHPLTIHVNSCSQASFELSPQVIP